MSNLKSLLLQMKLDDNYEMRVIAEEEIVNSYEKLQQENDQLKKDAETHKIVMKMQINVNRKSHVENQKLTKALEVAEDALVNISILEAIDIIFDAIEMADEALAQIEKIKNEYN